MTDDARVGTQFGRYRIERVLGQGGFGTVYLAEDLNPHLRRRVALKILSRELAADQDFRERFLRESLMAIELDHHPSIVPVYDAGEEGGTLYIAMRHVEGTDLASALVQRGPFAAEEAASIISQIASALDVAHAALLVHRDVKPGNILLSPDLKRAYLADFGLTKRMSADSGITRAGQFLGTFYYAAPEQIEGRSVDGRTDEYALGCVLYETLTGQPPFSGDMNVIIAAHLTQPAPAPSAARPDLPTAVDAVVARAMEKSPENRFATCGDMAAATTRALSREGETAHRGTGALTPPPPPPPSVGPVTPPPGPTSPPPGSGPGAPWTPPPAVPPRKRSPVPWLIGGGVLVALALILLLAFVVFGGDGGGDSFPNEDEDALLEQVPVSFRETCERATSEETGEEGEPGVGGEEAAASVRCTPDEAGADVVFYTQFESRDAVRDAFAVAAADGDVEDTGEDCLDVTGVEHDFVTEDNVEGRVLCFRDGGESFIVWSSEELRTVASAARGDRMDSDLYDWWTELIDRTPPDDTGDGDDGDATGLTPDEQALIGHVPVEFSATCVGLQPARDAGEVAVVECTPVSGADTAFYTQYDSAASMGSEYDAIISDLGISRDSGSGCDVGPPSENPYTVDSADTGRAVCFSDEDDAARILWTHDTLLIVSEGVRDDADYPALLSWWESEAGPI